MTPERVEIILEALGNGATQRDASMLAGISEDTLCIWKRTNSEFSEQIAQKVIEYKQRLMQKIEKAGENPITFVFLVELPRIVIIPQANRVHRRKDIIKNWDDLVGIETLIKKYEEEYKGKEE